MYDIREMQKKGPDQWKDGCTIFAKCKKSPDQWKDGCMIFAKCKKGPDQSMMDVKNSRNVKIALIDGWWV